MRPQESKAPAPSTSTYKFTEHTATKRPVAPTNPAPIPTAPRVVAPVTEKEIIRGIVAPETVKIPRRETEGVRPIFDREELRESILRRMKSGDNEENPGVEQRVVAIIR